jgi:hypothetical protein
MDPLYIYSQERDGSEGRRKKERMWEQGEKQGGEGQKVTKTKTRKGCA